MKPAELAGKVTEAIQAATADNSLVFSDREIDAEQLDDIELRIGRIFEQEAKRLKATA